MMRFFSTLLFAFLTFLGIGYLTIDGGFLIGFNQQLQFKGPQMDRAPTDAFAGFLLAVSFSHSLYSSVPFIEWLYQHFGLVYICGDPQNGPVPDSVHPVSVTKGWHQHRCLMQAMREYPDYKGYIGSNDDLILHPWYVATWDFEKCWIEKGKRFTPLMSNGLLRNEYIPGEISVDHLGDLIEYGKPALRKAHHALPDEFKSNLSLYTGGADVYCEGDNNFVNIPAIHRKAFVDIAAFSIRLRWGFHGCTRRPRTVSVRRRTYCNPTASGYGARNVRWTRPRFTHGTFL